MRSLATRLAGGGGGGGDGPARSPSVTSFASTTTGGGETGTRRGDRDSLPSINVTLGVSEDFHASCFGDDSVQVKESGTSARLFEEMLRGRRPAPWRPEVFLDHCESELNAESLHYYYEIEGMKRLSGDASAVVPSEDLLLVPAEERANVRAWADKVVDLYVVDSAPQQVNISATQREATIKRAKQIEELGPSAFDESQQEVIRLMHHDIFPRFAKTVLTNNISQGQSRHMYVQAAVLFALLLAGQALCLGFFVYRPYFLLFLPAWMFAVNHLYAAKRRFCVRTCMLNKVFVGTNTEAIECPLTKRYHHAKAKIILLKIASAASILTLIPIFISFAVEAGLGKTLY